jgi:hypothetical protein
VILILLLKIRIKTKEKIQVFISLSSHFFGLVMNCIIVCKIQQSSTLLKELTALRIKLCN